LPIALNRACKLTGYFIGQDKEYVGIMRIHKDIPLNKIKKAIKEKFSGRILQMPPVKSRVKRQEREREVKLFELLEKDGKDILFHVLVQGGTYIRKLISDLGDYMKIGAHMLELRRTRACIFKEDDENYPSVNLFEFEKAVSDYKDGNEKPLMKIIIPAEIISEFHPSVEVKETSLEKLFTGKPILFDDLKKETKFEKNEIVSVFCENKFIGMYEILNTKNSQENFGATKSHAVSTRRQSKDFVGKKHAFAKPKFVLQPIRKN